MAGSHTDNPNILLVGDISRSFTDIRALGSLPCEVCTNALDAIDTASNNNFDVIAVVLSNAAQDIRSALRSLRQAAPGAALILLAQMHEEPLAMQLAAAGSNGTRLIDDYVICPVPKDQFITAFSPSRPEPEIPQSSSQADRQTQQKIRQLEELATTDELTGLKNRRYIWEFTKQIIAHAQKTDGRVTLMIFDIDNFKHYNDVYSHLAGDEILRQAAILMKKSCRAHDIVGRIGGDEFAVIFWDDPRKQKQFSESERRSRADHPREAIFIANRFRSLLKKTELPMLGDEGKGVLAISGGLASFPRDGKNIQELFAQADRALLDAKKSGKNRIYLVGRSEGDIDDIKD
jgi:diguanylate cyclase (GGDEF)-like protein